MMKNLFRAGTVLFYAALSAGCTTPGGQLATCQQEKEQLLTTIRQQRETSRALKTQVASLESRLNEAETELARGNSATRISSRPAEPVKGAQPVKAESLPWRSPPATGTSPASADRPTKTSNSKARSVSLSALANHDERLHYDRSAGTARLDAPIEFAEGSATLTAQGKRQLDDIARLLKTDEARDFRVMVTGQTDTSRAKAVTDYLDRHGIAGERLGVSSAVPTSPSSHENRVATTGVQIYLLEPSATVAGWKTGSQPARR
jgi:outer membrane protein OmpA-like peptidoglycan-associated protein